MVVPSQAEKEFDLPQLFSSIWGLMLAHIAKGGLFLLIFTNSSVTLLQKYTHRHRNNVLPAI
jgi:hypothetical protein